MRSRRPRRATRGKRTESHRERPMRLPPPARIALATVIALLTAACGDSTQEGTITKPTTSVAPEDTAVPESTTSVAPEDTAVTETSEATTSGETPDVRSMTINVDGRDRSYLLFVPPGHNADAPAPLVINLHGGPGSGLGQLHMSGFNELAAEQGIVVVYPSAFTGFWDFEDGEGTDRPDLNDLEFITAVIDRVSADVSIDPGRIYAIGFSMGTGMSNILACRMPDRIAAIAQVAGFMHMDGPACPEPEPTRVLAIIGEADPITSHGTQDLPLADQPLPADVEARAWVTTNSCDADPEVTQLLEGVTRSVYSCDADAALIVYRHPGGHTWPAVLAPDTATNELIWEFLSGPTVQNDTGSGG